VVLKIERYRKIEKMPQCNKKETSIKIVVLGKAGVGKSAVTTRFLLGQFVPYYDPTIEERYHKVISVDDKEVMCNIVDSAGLEMFKGIQDLYLTLGDAFVFVYDVTEKHTFLELKDIFESLQYFREDDPPIAIMANNVDLPSDRRKVTQDEGHELAKRFNDATHLEVSALSGLNIEKAFLEAAQKGYHHRNRVINEKELSKHNKRHLCALL